MKLKDAMVRASAKFPAGGIRGSVPYVSEVMQLKRSCTKTTALVKIVKSDSDNE